MSVRKAPFPIDGKGAFDTLKENQCPFDKLRERGGSGSVAALLHQLADPAREGLDDEHQAHEQ